MVFASYFHDPDNLFLPILEALGDEIPKEVKGAVIAVSPSTTKKVKQKLIDMEFKLTEGGSYGVGKNNAVRESLRVNGSNYFFVCDFDKFLHWIITDKDEFLNILAAKPDADLTIIARSPRALATYPESWKETEQIAVHLMGKYLNQRIDYLNGPFILSKSIARIISEESQETGVGVCAEWVLLAHVHNKSISNKEVKGLTWEDPDRYSHTIDKVGNFEEWKELYFDSAYEWRKRVEFLHQQIVVILRLLDEPENPKYPEVSNKTYSNKTF